MRIVSLGLLVLAAVGCGGTHADPSWTLFVDDAALAAVNHAGQPWCAGLSLRVVVDAAGTRGETSAQPAPAPSWHEPVLTADAGSFERGLFVDVRGRCADGSEFRVGAAQVQPGALTPGAFAVGPLGSVTSLALAFGLDGVEPAGPAPAVVGCDHGIACAAVDDGVGVVVGDPGYVEPGDDPGAPAAQDCTDPAACDPGATDPGATDPGATDPGATDPGATDPGATDPGATDPGATDPGATDPGATDPTDPNATDPGLDGSDPSDCTDCSLARHPNHRRPRPRVE